MAAGEIETVRQRIEIVDLIAETVPLKRAGRGFQACCPFHTEKTPSFHVNPERQTWHCYGACNTGGDAFAFVMKRDSLEFGEALRLLAERAGVALSRGGDQAQRDQHARLYAANEAAIIFFRHALQGEKSGQAARAYAEQRGLDAATLERFEIGFAPEGWDNLHSFLLTRGFSEAELLAAGLVIEGERGAYDRFRGRLMFPIRDERGRAAGFGGRALGDEKPKYLNTPQTPVFDKGSLLFLLDRARDGIRQASEAVLVEGYLDAITAHQFGYTNVVATLGTALTDRHIALLRRLARRVTLAMDADAAGIQAALRGEEVARAAAVDQESRTEVVVAWDALVRAQARAPVEVRVFTVPSGKDPDDAIREDPQGWPDWVAAAVPPFEFRLRHELAQTNLDDPRARVEMADRMLPLLLQISDRALQASYVEKLAHHAAVPADTLFARLRSRAPRGELGTAVLLRRRAAGPPGQQQAPPPALEPQPLLRTRDPEVFVLSLLLRYATLSDAAELLDDALFQQTPLRLLFDCWRAKRPLLEEDLPAELQETFRTLIALDLPAFSPALAEAALLESVQKLRRRALTERKRQLHAELAETDFDEGATAALAARMSSGGELLPSEISEPVLAAIGRQRDDEYLMKEIHALEWEWRTHKEAPWVRRARAQPGAGAEGGHGGSRTAGPDR